MVFTQIQTQITLAALGVALMALAGQTYRLHSEQRDHAVLRAKVAERAQVQQQAVTAQVTQDAKDTTTHATSTQKASDAFTSTQPSRDVVARADYDLAVRLRDAETRRASTYRAQAQASTDACGHLADRLEAFDRHIVQGVTVVAGLRKDLTKRDAEVALLYGRLQADETLLNSNTVDLRQGPQATTPSVLP